MQFQKFEPRFGGRRALPEEERNRRDLTLEDAVALKRLATLAAAVSPERYLFDGRRGAGRAEEANGPVVVGATPDYASANNHFVQDGRFLIDADVRHAARVAVIGDRRRRRALPAAATRSAAASRSTAAPTRSIGVLERKGVVPGRQQRQPRW